ncbi:PadR family transcriptional regulator [Erwinia billingiae]|uniref:PadR family transcriptional regulator n=1 Tax=Erwinia billingiae TaxID=182337 RepID=UPI002246ECE8|nr:helix-turn-helix transcriptional regulator [Erwinia billingiae]MCX0500232.1 PadR family transcriptional regulator [Erwinia billingiae]
MFKEMFNDRRGGRHPAHSSSPDRRSECFQQAESREEALAMMFDQWRDAMRNHRMHSRHDDSRGEHHHRHHQDAQGERQHGRHNGACGERHHRRLEDSRGERHFDRRGDRHDGHRGGHRGGRDDAGHRDRPSFLRGRKFGADELQLLLLSLLKEQASYGYELIKILTDKSGGFYTPSPGVIYPALTYLEDVGFVTVQQEGNRKRYAINEQGEAHLNENKAVADALIAKLALFASQSDSVSQAMFEHRQPFSPELTQAIHNLRSQLHAYHGSDEDTQRQVAEILQATLVQMQSVGR